MPDLDGHTDARTLFAKDPPRRIGLALSGGGSRAIAFHLGCLRALHDRGVLEKISVISAVSGGSVVTALYAYGGDRDFASWSCSDVASRGE
jgi:NTE family protein